MRIIVYGATGMIGQRIVDEALSRGHEVVAVSRNPSALKLEHPKLSKRSGNITDPKSVEILSNDADVIISAIGPDKGGNPSTLSDAARSILEGTSKSGNKPFYFVGGAGSLEIAPHLQLVDTPTFPEAYKSAALAHREALRIFQNSSSKHWTYLSPAAMIAPGERTGKYRLGGDQLVLDSEGNSKISAEDYAVALLDEIESPKHTGKRFTLAY
ncbi:dihydrodipicolinate reductase-like domain protein [Leptospira broomii serovar Hurstbridge str. 5399]|uniref:Dihydrodipicolinate reductase-like domain protein n=1 Tax=Leptospira broomii serovar Hurstbridge str. 5399 TaxID=1049789 RepID=T0F763_9LEPT|nr:NAD(P)H-binding protein [Leptospira broomii]EQA43357.1 dihydrodipicolinate reductase-like domain protein [Leptospira broomii serovar Hurstbridge str. 5399]